VSAAAGLHSLTVLAVMEVFRRGKAGPHLRGRGGSLSNRGGRVLNYCLRFAHAALPTHCVLCGDGTRASRLCTGCAASLPRLPATRCSVCAVPLTSGSTCGDCLAHPPFYHRICAPYAYAFPADALIQAYKYRGDLTLAPLLATAVARVVDTAVDALIPMPLAPARLRERGFNQAHELARHLGRALRIPVLGAACRKVAETPPQAALPWTERSRNVRGAFVCDADLTGMRVAIVDDVMTTGATINELARNLRRAGAGWVGGWVAARTPREGPRP
jgi:ComF family protein